MSRFKRAFYFPIKAILLFKERMRRETLSHAGKYITNLIFKPHTSQIHSLNSHERQAFCLELRHHSVLSTLKKNLLAEAHQSYTMVALLDCIYFISSFHVFVRVRMVISSCMSLLFFTVNMQNLFILMSDRERKTGTRLHMQMGMWWSRGGGLF